MRATISDVVRHPSWIASWWIDCPWRRLRNFRTLLFMEGRGWLRWKTGTYDYVETVDPWLGGPTYSATCFPPLRRLLIPTLDTLSWIAHGFGWHRDDDLGWFRLKWREHHSPLREAWVYACDPEWPQSYLVGPPKHWGVAW